MVKSAVNTADILRKCAGIAYLCGEYRVYAVTDETLHAVLKKARFWEKHAATPLNNRQRIILNKLPDGFDGKLNTSKWAKITKTSQDTALRDIQDLIGKQILVKERGGGRSTSYVLMELG